MSKIDQSIFKLYDIRGIYPSQLNKEVAYKIGQALVSFLHTGSKVHSQDLNIVVGRDMRVSSPVLHQALTSGIIDSGANVVDIGLSATPTMYFTVANFGYDGGVNVTASHNPKEWNGFKMVRKEAIPIRGNLEIKNLALKQNFLKSHTKGKIIPKNDVCKAQIEHDLKPVNLDLNKLKKFKIVADPGSGMAGLYLSELFSKLKLDLVKLNFDLDGTFPVHPANPLAPGAVSDLQKKVKRGKADLGIATDGDGDRIIFIDEKGKLVRPDIITGLLAKEVFKKYPKGKVLFDVQSGWTTKEMIKEAGGKPILCPTGHTLIKENMRKEGAVFAGECSGHYYLSDNFYIESPVIVILMILKILKETQKPLSEIIKPYQKYFKSGEMSFKIKDGEKKSKEIERAFSDGEISSLDGVSVEYPDWHFNLRPSHTEPFLRLTVEAKTKELLEEKTEGLLSLIKG